MAVDREGSGLVLDGDLLPVSEQKSVFGQVKKMLQSPNVVSTDDKKCTLFFLYC